MKQYVPPFDINSDVKLRRTLSASRPLCKLIHEYLKLTEMDSILVIGSVEDERCFSTLKFFKSFQRNMLEKHLPLVVEMIGQKYLGILMVQLSEESSHKKWILGFDIF